MAIFGPNEDWTQGAYFGTRGTFFADVTGDGRADAIVVNDDTVTVRRSTGTGFGPNEDWTQGAYFGTRGTFFADVTGDGRADAIVVNDDTVTVRRSVRESSPATITWAWAILLCRFADIQTIPQQPEYYADLLATNGMGGVADYWRAVSGNGLDLTASRVFGWFNLNHTTAEYEALVNQLHSGSRGAVVQWARAAARAAAVDLTPYRNVLTVMNHKTPIHDHGAVSVPGDVLILHAGSTTCEFGFICHEMGHGMGLPHSWSATPDFEYGDGWDLMSFATTTFQYPIVFQGSTGVATVGLNARNVEALGVVSPRRVWRPPGPDFSEAVVLGPLNQSPLGNQGPLIIKIPADATTPTRPSGSTWTVEFRRKAGWDQSIPEDSVSVREVRLNGISYLQPSAGARFTAGDQYVTPEPQVFLRIVAIDAATETASVRIWDLPAGSLRREDSKAKVYLIQNGAKRWVTSPAALVALGKTWTDVRTVPDGGLTGVPDGPDLT
jgi:hypothetical protein